MRRGRGSLNQVPATPCSQPSLPLCLSSWWAQRRWLKASGCITVLLWKTRCGYCKLLLANICWGLCFLLDLAASVARQRPRISSWLTCCVLLGSLEQPPTLSQPWPLSWSATQPLGRLHPCQTLKMSWSCPAFKSWHFYQKHTLVPRIFFSFIMPCCDIHKRILYTFMWQRCRFDNAH